MSQTRTSTRTSVSDVIAQAARQAAEFMRAARTADCSEHTILVWSDGEVELTPTVNVSQLLFNEDEDGDDARDHLALMTLDPGDAQDADIVTPTDEDPSDTPHQDEVEMWAQWITDSDDGRIAGLLQA